MKLVYTLEIEVPNDVPAATVGALQKEVRDVVRAHGAKVKLLLSMPRSLEESP